MRPSKLIHPSDDMSLIDVVPRDGQFFTLRELQAMCWGGEPLDITVLRPPNSLHGLLVVAKQDEALRRGLKHNPLATEVMSHGRGDGVIVPILGTSLLAWDSQLE